MKRTYLGEFEEIVLLAVAVTDGQAYGAALLLDIGRQTGRDLRLNQVHSALQRLEEKGMVKSAMGEPTAERGGKRKRLFFCDSLRTANIERDPAGAYQLLGQADRAA